jgi:tripartite-type tricarboxylate transporter receptor subunit TctC
VNDPIKTYSMAQRAANLDFRIRDEQGLPVIQEPHRRWQSGARPQGDRRMFRTLPAVLAALAIAAQPAFAQDAYPSRPIQIVLPLQVGSASDIAVRIVAERLAEILGQNVVVENPTGVGGLIGANRLATARPDGYTIAALNNSILTILPQIKPKEAKFDSFADFVPIRGLANIPTFLGVPKDSPAANVKELIALAKAQPGVLNYSTGGPGSPQHLATEMFQEMAGVKLTHVPYKGATAAAADLAAGRVQVMFIAHSLALPYLPGERVKLIAFAGSERSRAIPNLPTVAESGVPGFDYASWVALFAIKGTPPEIVAKLRDATAKAMATPGLAERLAKSGLEIWDTPADRLATVTREDWARWEKVVKAAGLAEN